jgi:glycosyltransferase involved in cell wall biosynthesis
LTTPRKPLRVCHIAYSFYETDNRVMRYAETLAARGDHVDVVALRRPGQGTRATVGGVNILRVQRRAVSERTASAYLFKILWFFVKCLVLLSVRSLSKPYDIVHVHNMPDFLVFTAAVQKLRGAAVILDIHDVVPELYAGKFGKRQDSRLIRAMLSVERASCRFADHVIVANQLWHERLARRSLSPGKSTTILNYPDLAVFRPGSRDRADGDRRFVFLYPGTLNHHQGLDIAVAAFGEASPRMPGAELHIYGDGPDRHALRQQVQDLGLGDRVKIMDRVPLHNVPQLMAAADAGVVPKRADGFGNEAHSTKILEFMACGIPVIVSRTKVDAHYFTDDVVRFVRPGDVGDLALGMVGVYGQRGQHGRWIAAALEHARRNSWQEHANIYVGLVDRLTARV